MPGELARFLLVGLANTAISFGAYAALTAAAAPPALAAAAAFSAGAANGYVLNRRWTFRARGSVVRYAVVQLGGAAATSTSMGFVAGLLPYALTTACVTGATFVALRTWAGLNHRQSVSLSATGKPACRNPSEKKRLPWTATPARFGVSRDASPSSPC